MDDRPDEFREPADPETAALFAAHWSLMITLRDELPRMGIMTEGQVRTLFAAHARNLEDLTQAWDCRREGERLAKLIWLFAPPEA